MATQIVGGVGRWLCRWAGVTVLAGLALGGTELGGTVLRAQSAVGGAEELRVTMEQLVGLRDRFVAETGRSGFRCRMGAPKIELTDVPSYGSYEAETNTLKTPAWVQLKKQERALFYDLAGPGADEAAARELFERGTHRWVFAHEMAHWWQACTGVGKRQGHYEQEYDANRIAAAYWREKDPELVRWIVGVFHGMVEHEACPVPAGMKVEQYFDENYDALGRSSSYPWFQAKMVAGIEAEKPQPTFVEALAEGKAEGKKVGE